MSNTAQTWPECVCDEEGTWWVRADVEADVDRWTESYGRQYPLARVGEDWMTPRADGSDWLDAVPLGAPGEKALYVRFIERDPEYVAEERSADEAA